MTCLAAGRTPGPSGTSLRRRRRRGCHAPPAARSPADARPLARSALGGPRLRREGLRRHAPRGPPLRRRGRARGRGAARARPRAVVRPCSVWSPAARLCSTRLPSALAPPASPPPEAGRSVAHPRRTAPRLRGGRRGGASWPGWRGRGGRSGGAPWPGRDNGSSGALPRPRPTGHTLQNSLARGEREGVGG